MSGWEARNEQELARLQRTLREVEDASASLEQATEEAVSRNREGDDFARRMNNVMQPLEENLMLYLRTVTPGLRQASDGTVATARNYGTTEEHNIDAVGRLGSGAPGGGGGGRW